MTDEPTRRRVTIADFERLERKVDAILTALGTNHRHPNGVRTLANGDMFAPGTGTLRPPDNTHRTLSPEAAAALAHLDNQDHP